MNTSKFAIYSNGDHLGFVFGLQDKRFTPYHTVPSIPNLVQIKLSGLAS